MKHHTRLALAGLLSVVALIAAGCGGAGGGAGTWTTAGWVKMVAEKERRTLSWRAQSTPRWTAGPAGWPPGCWWRAAGTQTGGSSTPGSRTIGGRGDGGGRVRERRARREEV